MARRRRRAAVEPAPVVPFHVVEWVDLNEKVPAPFSADPEQTFAWRAARAYGRWASARRTAQRKEAHDR